MTPIDTPLDTLDAVNSDPDAELLDPEDDTIGHPCDEMSQWDLGDEEQDEGEDSEDGED